MSAVAINESNMKESTLFFSLSLFFFSFPSRIRSPLPSSEQAYISQSVHPSTHPSIHPSIGTCHRNCPSTSRLPHLPPPILTEHTHTHTHTDFPATTPGPPSARSSAPSVFLLLFLFLSPFGPSSTIPQGTRRITPVTKCDTNTQEQGKRTMTPEPSFFLFHFSFLVSLTPSLFFFCGGLRPCLACTRFSRASRHSASQLVPVVPVVPVIAVVRPHKVGPLFFFPPSFMLSFGFWLPSWYTHIFRPPKPASSSSSSSSYLLAYPPHLPA